MATTLAVFDWLQVLSDATRARLLRALERSELTVVELCSVLQTPQSTISRHLKVLSEAGWVVSRREGTSHWYSLKLPDLEAGQRKLWQVVRDQASAAKFAEIDDRRLEQVLADRQSRAQAFFSSAADQWDRLRSELFGGSVHAASMAGALSRDLVVGEIGCGTAPVSALLAAHVRQVIAVDNSAAMLRAARAKLKKTENIDLRRGEITSLPVADAELDLAFVVLVLVYVSDPTQAIRELARTIRPKGRLVLVDMYRHDRESMQQELGQVWLGFDPLALCKELAASGFVNVHETSLPLDSGVKGPPLFCLTADRG